MRFRFGRGLTLLRGGNSGTSNIGEDVLYITGLEGGLFLRFDSCTTLSLKSHSGRSGRGGTSRLKKMIVRDIQVGQDSIDQSQAQ